MVALLPRDPTGSIQQIEKTKENLTIEIPVKFGREQPSNEEVTPINVHGLF